MEKILLVDGMNLLFQMFYGMPSRILNSQGRPIQGTLGFVGALLKILNMVRPSHCAVLFDGPCANPRRELDESYKANRPDWSQMPEEDIPFSQLPDVYAALDLLGIPHAETTDCEADDWMARYARQWGREKKIIISSFDSDLFQLIGENVQILRYRGSQSILCDESYIRCRYSIGPEQYAQFKALVGDTSDNIRGVPGVGPKRAAWLLECFGSLEGIVAHAGEIRRPAISKAVAENGHRLSINERIITLSGEGPLPFSLEDMPYTPAGLSTMQVLELLGIR